MSSCTHSNHFIWVMALSKYFNYNKEKFLVLQKSSFNFPSLRTDSLTSMFQIIFKYLHKSVYSFLLHQHESFFNYYSTYQYIEITMAIIH